MTSLKQVIITVMILVQCILATAEKPNENLVKNGDFEDWSRKNILNGWDGKFSSKQNSDAAAGKSSLELTGQIGQNISLPAQGQYQLQFQLKKSGVSTLAVSVYTYDRNNKEITKKCEYFGSEKTCRSWTQFNIIFDVPENASHVAIFFNTNNGNMLLDDVVLKKIEAESNGKLVFQDDFSGKDLNKNWQICSGEWQVTGGALHTPGNGAGSVIKFANPLGRNLRLEYTCWSNSPCDLSACLAFNTEAKSLDGYFFGFGSRYNKVNTIIKIKQSLELAQTIMEGFSTGIEPGRKHRIVVERQDEVLKFYRDGKLELTTRDQLYQDEFGTSFALVSWDEGFFDDIKVFQLPENDLSKNIPERKVEFSLFEDFSKVIPGQIPESMSGINTRTVTFPTWTYKDEKQGTTVVVDDPCLELNPSGRTASVSCRVAGTETGIVEFDLLTETLSDIRIELANNNGDRLVTFLIDKDGRFWAEGDKGKVPLLDEIEYRRRQIYDNFRLMPNHWYTFRLNYDSLQNQLKNIAMLDYYAEMSGGYKRNDIDQGAYISLGSKVHFSKADKVSRIIFTTSGSSRLLLDNLISFGPVGDCKVDGRNILLPARKLLGLNYLLRRDPVMLKLQSLRHFTDKYPDFATPLVVQYRSGNGKNVFQQAGFNYNQAMIRHAFLRERIEQLERLDYYLQTQSMKDEITRLRRNFEHGEVLQEKALQALATAFLNNTDEKLLASEFEPALRLFKNIVVEQEKNLDIVFSKIAGKSAVQQCPADPVNEKWNLQYDPQLKLWRRNGRVEAFFLAEAQPVIEKVHQMGFQAALADSGIFYAGPTIKPGEFYDHLFMDDRLKSARQLQDKNKLSTFSIFNMQHGTHGLNTVIPKWYIEQINNDKDIYFCKNDGSRLEPYCYKGWPLLWITQLNFYNPQVRELFRKRFSSIGEAVCRNPEFGNAFILLGSEALTDIGGQEYGHNPSAIAAFQEMLKARYGSIGKLNKKWNCQYESFEKIIPPVVRGAPTPLQYEFQRFKAKGYFQNFIKMAKDGLENGFGGKLPVTHDFQETFSEFDMPEFFDNVSLVSFHSYQVWNRKIYPVWLSSLAQATGTPWGAWEWVIAQGLKTMFELEPMRLHGLREYSHLLMWGCASPNLFTAWSDGPNNWQYGMCMTDHRIGHLVFNYFSSFARIAKDRGVRFGEVALTASLVKPDAAILEVTSSKYNAPPVNAICSMTRNLALALNSDNWNYGHLYEQLLLDGRQQLDGIQTVFVPNGICIPRELDAKLEKFVSAGGTLIAYAPIGVFDEFGHPSAGLLSKVFSKAQWTHSNFSQWDAGREIHATKEINGIKLYTGKLGKGLVFIFTSPIDWANVQTETIELLNKYTRRSINHNNSDFQYCLREKNNKKYLYILNYSMEKTAEGEFSINGNYKADDVSMQINSPIRTVFETGQTKFKIRLSPAELTLVELSPIMP